MRKPTWRRRYLSRRRRRLSDGNAARMALVALLGRYQWHGQHGSGRPFQIARAICRLPVDARAAGPSVSPSRFRWGRTFECDWSAAYRPWRRAARVASIQRGRLTINSQHTGEIEIWHRFIKSDRSTEKSSTKVSEKQIRKPASGANTKQPAANKLPRSQRDGA